MKKARNKRAVHEDRRGEEIKDGKTTTGAKRKAKKKRERGQSNDREGAKGGKRERSWWEFSSLVVPLGNGRHGVDGIESGSVLNVLAVGLVLGFGWVVVTQDGGFHVRALDTTKEGVHGLKRESTRLGDEEVDERSGTDEDGSELQHE